MRILVGETWPYLRSPRHFCGMSRYVTVMTLPVEEISLQVIRSPALGAFTAHVPVDAFAHFLDDADDLMAEDAGAGIWAAGP